MSNEFYWIAVVAVTIICSARLTRLAVYDKFPPVKWLRDKYAEATDPSNWQLLALCGYCFSFWAVLADVGLGLAAHVYGHPPNQGVSPDWQFLAWWVVNGVFAMSYLAAWFIAHDGDKSASEPPPVREPSFRRTLATYVATGQATPEQVETALRIDEGRDIETGDAA